MSVVMIQALSFASAAPPLRRLCLTGAIPFSDGGCASVCVEANPRLAGPPAVAVVDFRFFDLLWTIPDQPPATAGGSDKTEPATDPSALEGHVPGKGEANDETRLLANKP